MKPYLLLLLLSCAPTREAVLRDRESDQLRTCLITDPGRPHRCVQQSRDRCRNMGLELECGLPGLYP